MPPDFKADAVRLYVNDPEPSYVTTAQSLGIPPNTLKNWVRKAGAGELTADAAGRSSNPTLDVALQAVIEEENRRLTAEVARLWRQTKDARRDYRRESGRINAVLKRIRRAPAGTLAPTSSS